MKNGYKATHWCDSNGNPAGGITYGTGFAIGWQNGPLGQGIDRQPPNGAFVEDVIDAVLDRLGYYQITKFACPENEKAMKFLAEALEILQARTKDRENRGVEGTHKI